MVEKTLDENLVMAIENHDAALVLHCLEKGADPNHTRHWDNESNNQPTTPLRLVMFCISDALLDDDGLRQFTTIAKLLLQYGADPKPAMQLAELRYGKYDPNAPGSPFMDVWRIVAGDAL